jgi:hypothetical protein
MNINTAFKLLLSPYFPRVRSELIFKYKTGPPLPTTTPTTVPKQYICTPFSSKQKSRATHQIEVLI